MPNWCKGVLKARGKKKDLLNFLNNGIERCGYPIDANYDYTKYPLGVKIDDWGCYFVEKTDSEHDSWLYIKDSRRCFIEENIEWYLEDLEDNDEEICYLDIKQAWRLEPDYFKEISKIYNVDFRIMGFECGMQFVQEIEVIKGNITLNKVTKYDDYNWEAYDPRLGG